MFDVFEDPCSMVGMASPHSYTPVGDVTVVGMCMLIFLLLIQTCIRKSKDFIVLIMMLVLTCISAFTEIMYQFVQAAGTVHILSAYLFRSLHHIALSALLVLYIHYLQNSFRASSTLKDRTFKITSGLTILAVAVDTLGTPLHYSFYIEGDGTVHNLFNVYALLLFVFNITVFYLIIHYRERVIKQVFWGLLSANLVSVVIMIIQRINDQMSYTGVTYFFPIMAIVFIFHSNPFDHNTGAASDTYLFHALDVTREPLLLVSYQIKNFSRIIVESKDLKYEYHRFLRHYVRKGIIYRLENDRLVLTMPKMDDESQEQFLKRLHEGFLESYAKLEMDFKTVVMETTDEVQSSTDYIRIIEDAERMMPFNTVHRITDADIEMYYKSNYILNELEDIAARHDLDDTRVLVYCQPVFNISTGTYDTAEALMRLELPKTGMVYPDLFIPLAEQYGHIHALSMIILNKTCGAIRTLMEEGLDIKRISVNFSTLDIRYESFCREVQQIIDRNQIPYNKIAIEITESRSEADFNIMKARVEELRKLGIKFYLDDFGTGYSNFERIMEIPFDIIKFDRSMTIESNKNEDSFYMVSTFANMFSNLHYAVLFEGIADEVDESNCVKMSAQYLQGYKYSKPIPIEQLGDFLMAKQVS